MMKEEKEEKEEKEKKKKKKVKTNLDEKPVIYYIDKDNLDYEKIIFALVNELLRPKYSNVMFYCHNLGAYDIVFILSTLYAYNDNNSEHMYNISCLLRGKHIIKAKRTKGKKSFTILDSYAMLPEKLIKLGDNFGVSTIKSVFPYKFATEDQKKRSKLSNLVKRSGENDNMI